MSLLAHPFFEPSAGSYSFIVSNPESRCCAIIDPVLGDSTNGQCDSHNLDLMLDWVHAHEFHVRWILDTGSARQASGCAYLKNQLLCAQTGSGASRALAQGYDRPLSVGDTLCLDHACGRVVCLVSAASGQVAYQFGDMLFVGQVLSADDEPVAPTLNALSQFTPHTRVYLGHQALLGGARGRFVTTVGALTSLARTAH